MFRIGIMAYGSLVDHPGYEMANLVVERIPRIQTPFEVEFARASKGRDGAPTLVPVEQLGSPVTATVFVLRSDVSLDHARNVLWRRETGRAGDYEPSGNPTKNTVLVGELTDVAGIDIVLYARLGANIAPLSAETLAARAIDSAKAAAGRERRDGISYLIDAIENGISTPLTPEYQTAILEKTGASSLEQAWALLQPNVPSPAGR